MKRFAILAACLLVLPSLSVAQPGRDNRPGDDRQDNRPSERPGGGERPGGERPGGDRRPNRPERPVTLPAPVRPDRPGNPNFRPRPDRPQFSWRGRSYNPIRGPLYRYPPGYGYRRWDIGTFLPRLFFAPSYYYEDWRTLGIEPPPPGRRWVRYGPDLLLVNVRNRRVEDVIYGVFY